MMYHNKLVATIRCRGKILREHGETVQIPFGSEYSIQLKNLDACRRAIVAIDIDGRDVLDGGSLVIEPAEIMNVERFIVDGQLDRGPKFKFVERTDGIEKSRGIYMEDGIVNITFRYEEPKKVFVAPPSNPWYNPSPGWPPTYGGPTLKGASRSADGSTLYSSRIDPSIMNISASVSTSNDAADMLSMKNDEGITVKGSESKQKFEETTIRENDLGDSYNIVFKLKGGSAKPLGTKTKIVCSDCKTKNKSSNKFCGNCGSNLKYA